MIGLAKTQKFYGVEFAGERHDCGSKPGFLRANIAFGMARPELRDGLLAEMKKYRESAGRARYYATSDSFGPLASTVRLRPLAFAA